MWNKIKTWADAFWNKAWTKLVGQAQLVTAALTAIAGYLGNIVNDPSVKTALSAVAMPTWAALGIAVFGVVTLMSLPKAD